MADCSYMYMRASNVYLLAITKGDTNAMMTFQFLSKVGVRVCEVGVGTWWAGS